MAEIVDEPGELVSTVSALKHPETPELSLEHFYTPVNLLGPIDLRL